MGNQSSRDEADVHRLLTTLSSAQQNALKTQYTELLCASSQHKASVKAIDSLSNISITQFSENLSNWAPASFQPELAAAFALYFATSSGSQDVISFNGFVKSAKTLLSLTPAESAQAFYRLYTLAFKRDRCSVEVFSRWIVNTAVPLWFESSGIACAADDLWRDKIQESGAARLTDHLVYRQVKRKEERMRRQQEEAALWMEDTGSTSQDESLSATWREQVTQTRQPIEESAFITWVLDTPSIRILAQISAKRALFGTAMDRENIHEKRIAGEIAPAIQQPTGSMFPAGSFSRLLTAYDYFMLARQLPGDALSWNSYEQAERHTSDDVEHKLLFSSKRDGSSWQIFVNRIVNQGATLLIIKSKDGAVFGGYANAEWQPMADWYGCSSNYVFRIGEKYEDAQLMMDVWDGEQGSNDHFQYLCWGKKTLPNGLGMGGQLGYEGLWVNEDFLHGRSKAGPLCTTYQSPQLSYRDTFAVEEVEVLLVRPNRHDEDMSDSKGGVLSRSEDMEFMEMAGKKMYSRDLAEPEHQEGTEDST